MSETTKNRPDETSGEVPGELQTTLDELRQLDPAMATRIRELASASLTLGRAATAGAPIDETFEELRVEVAVLREELRALRAELAAEVRTGRLVVVDELGHERIYSHVNEDNTVLWIDGPPPEPERRRVECDDQSNASVSITAANGELTDNLGRSVAASAVTVWAKGTPGAALTAEEFDGTPDRKGAMAEQRVRGSVEAFDVQGLGAARLTVTPSLRLP